MTKREIVDYKVIERSKDNKEFFNRYLLSDHIELMGTFKNEYGELYVITRDKMLPKRFLELSYMITGDELSWELDWRVDKLGYIYHNFLTNKQERTRIKAILRKKTKYNELI